MQATLSHLMTRAYAKAINFYIGVGYMLPWDGSSVHALFELKPLWTSGVALPVPKQI